ncbi:hypothetical protein GW796_10220 [archaeon]|nr:hypothetical protein [archaeon]
MEKVVFAGSFDSLTNDYLVVIQEGVEIPNKIVVLVAKNKQTNKNSFSDQERKDMVVQSYKEHGIYDQVEVHILDNEYLAKKSLQIGASHLIRRIRSANDYDYESLIQKTNTDILNGAKTIFVMPPRELETVSSSFIKSLMETIGWYWTIKQFVPNAVYVKILENFVRKLSKKYIQHEGLDDFLDLVITNYSKKDRHYHNLEHIVHCLQEMEWLQKNKKVILDYEQLCIAILSHDIIYGKKGDKSDEVLSAELILKYFGNKYLVANDLVLSTQHFKNISTTIDMKIMKDIDLAILGQDWKIYNIYTENIRKEYSSFSLDEYTLGRIKVVSSFLGKEKIFDSDIFNHYELIARENLKKELNNLERVAKK